VNGRAFAYPSTAPELEPGTRYGWRLGTEGRYRDEEASFEIATAEDAQRIRGLLAELDGAGLGTTPPATVALLRAGLLLREGLADAARRELLAAIAKDGSDPTLYHFLGHVYDRLGLRERARDAFREAQAVSARTP
jgi:Flp pilus assembly protein TadD